MKKAIVRIEITEDEYPLLFNIKDDKLEQLYEEIFKNGYKNLFPNTEERENCPNEVLKYYNYHTDSIKSDIQKINTEIQKIDLDNKINKFSQIMEDLFAISQNSSKKGKLTENLIYNFLRSRFKDYAIEETRNIAHRGDGIIFIPSGKTTIKALLEIKNYAKCVDNDEINKLIYDMKYNEIKYSVFISMKSAFVGKKQFCIDQFIHNNEAYTIIFVPNVNDEISKIESSVLLLEKIIEIDRKMKKNFKTLGLTWIKDINRELKELDTIYTDYISMKQKYLKMESNIKTSLDDFYLSLRNYENELKGKINKIWKNINSEIGEAEKQLIISSKIDKMVQRLERDNKPGAIKNIIQILEALKRKNLSIQETENETLIYILKNEELIGTIVRSDKKKINLFISKPVIFTCCFNNKGDISNEIKLLLNFLQE